jgi:putative hydrolase of the HAD superfamily
MIRQTEAPAATQNGQRAEPPALSAVETWVFDLDDTLYDPALRLFDQVNEKITAYVMRELRLDRDASLALRRTWYEEHGTTLAGLMAVHAIDPDPFLDEVHAIDLSAVAPDARLREALTALPGRKVIYTNGGRAHARGIAAALGLEDCFEGFFGVEDAGYAVKPHRHAFEAVFAAVGLTPARAAMIEDSQRNLTAPAAMGMATIWRPADPAEARQDHVHHVATDLATFLTETARG